MASKIDQWVTKSGKVLATRDNYEPEPIQIQQKSQKRLIKNRDNKRVSHKKKPDQKSQVKLDAGDEKLIADYIQQQEQIAISSTTEALTTTKNVLKAIGKNPEGKALQGEVSKTLKSLGWKKLGKKTYQGKQQRVWGKNYPTPSLTKEIKKGWDKGETIDRQATSPPIPPPELNNQTRVIESPVKPVKTPSVTEPVIETEVVKTDLPYGEEDIEQVKRILLFVEEEDLGDEDFTGVFAQWERELGLGLFEKACELLPIETVNKLREWVPQVKAVAKQRKSLVEVEVLEDIDIAYTCDVVGIPLELGDKVKLYSEPSKVAPMGLGEVIKIERCNVGIKLVVQWSNSNRCSDYFGKDRRKTTGSYFVNIKELRKMICENGQWVVATL